MPKSWKHCGKRRNSSFWAISFFVSVFPFPHIDSFRRLCSRRLFENNVVTKEEIARNEQLLLLPQCFPVLVIGYPFNYRDLCSIFWQSMLKVVCCKIGVWGKGLKHKQRPACGKDLIREITISYKHSFLILILFSV